MYLLDWKFKIVKLLFIHTDQNKWPVKPPARVWFFLLIQTIIALGHAIVVIYILITMKLCLTENGPKLCLPTSNQYMQK